MWQWVFLRQCVVLGMVKAKALGEKLVASSIDCFGGSGAEILGAGFVGIGGFDKALSL